MKESAAREVVSRLGNVNCVGEMFRRCECVVFA